jgi:predicted lactoylglutathione lyase
MTTTSESPTIANAGTVPTTPRKLFVNLPVSDVQRSIQFFEALGFVFNPQFTDASGTCMLVGEDAYFMLMSEERFAGFSRRPAADSAGGSGAIFTVSTAVREEVDELVETAIAAGGSRASDPQDHEFMYQWSFLDPDGHQWEVVWMDPSMAG